MNDIKRIAINTGGGDQAKQAKLIEGIARSDGLFLSFFLDVEAATNWVKGMNFLERLKPRLAGNPVKV